jgi:hypothetical protein
MMKFIRVLIILVMPFIFLVLGFRAGILTSSSAESGEKIANTGQAADAGAFQRSRNQQQVNYLVVSVGSRNAGNLQSVWLISNHISDTNLVNFVPLYPLSKERSAQLNELMESTFALTQTGEVSPAFLETLQAMYMLRLDATIVLDSTEISQAINLLGGLDLADTHVNGDQLLASLESSTDGQLVSAENHSGIIRSICLQLANTQESERLVTFADYLAAHLIVIDRKSAASAEMLRKIITNPLINCQFPTLTVQ